MNNSSGQCLNAIQEFTDTFDFLVNCPLTNNIERFKNFLKLLAAHKLKHYYFELHPSKLELFKLVYNLKDDIAQRVKVNFTWDTIRVFGTEEQKKAFNDFRRMYVFYLIQQFCYSPNNVSINSSSNTTKQSNTCNYKVIGTPAISVESDMDFDITVKTNDIDIGQILTRISNKHHEYFALELNELFDTNLYGSVFLFDPTKHNNPSPSFIEKQNRWSWIRTVEIFTDPKYVSESLLQYFKKHLLSSHQILFDKTLEELKTLNNDNQSFNLSSNALESLPEFLTFEKDTTNISSISRNKSSPELFKRNTKIIPIERSKSLYCSRNKIESYTSCLSSYFENINNGKLDDISEHFSLAKYYENETYRSLGAVLHIVNKLTDINKNFFVHSVYDQFGFVVECILETKIKENMLIDVIPKASKYISRICDAVEKIGIQDKIINYYEIKNTSEELNNVRRTGNKVQTANLARKMQVILVNTNISNTQTSHIDFLLGVYINLVKPIGIFQNEFNKQQGGKKTLKKKMKHK